MISRRALRAQIQELAADKAQLVRGLGDARTELAATQAKLTSTMAEAEGLRAQLDAAPTKPDQAQAPTVPQTAAADGDGRTPEPRLQAQPDVRRRPLFERTRRPAPTSPPRQCDNCRLLAGRVSDLQRANESLTRAVSQIPGGPTFEPGWPDGGLPDAWNGSRKGTGR